ncbi:hypothetical protein [Piscinibacter sp.]|uniref:hypothetical protein n=1 Tax=Piscinibacter sp. TaxID=1903157 RepID=UPI002CD46F08|nr:hypothetical protein [Albitalea sp.]HUG26468.1 hypothetical protein [Albitalea sp.]
MTQPAEAAPLLAQALAVQQRLPSHEAERLRSELLQVELELAQGQAARAATLLKGIEASLATSFPALHQAFGCTRSAAN